MQWPELIAAFWWWSQQYTEDARREKELGDRIRSIAHDFHVISTYVQQLRAW